MKNPLIVYPFHNGKIIYSIDIVENSKKSSKTVKLKGAAHGWALLLGLLV